MSDGSVRSPDFNSGVQDDLRARIAAIIDTHSAVGSEGQVTCWCDSQQFDGFHAHSLHAADAVIRELGLRREVLPSGGVTDPVHGSTWFRQGGSRWVSEWVPDG
jgi:hypothetical protein